jgi:hypothetical protein
MVEGTRPGLTLPDAAQTGDRCNKVAVRVMAAGNSAAKACRALVEASVSCSAGEFSFRAGTP